MSRSLFRTALALLAASILLAAGAPAQSGEPRTSLADLEDEVMCLVCGTTLELSESPQAEQERRLIRDLIARGYSKDEVKAALVAEYGEDVLATPGSSGFDLTAWVLPGVGFALALAALAFWLVRRQRSTAPAPPPPDPAEAERLRADMAREDV